MERSTSKADGTSAEAVIEMLDVAGEPAFVMRSIPSRVRSTIYRNLLMLVLALVATVVSSDRVLRVVAGALVVGCLCLVGYAVRGARDVPDYVFTATRFRLQYKHGSAFIRWEHLPAMPVKLAGVNGIWNSDPAYSIRVPKSAVITHWTGSGRSGFHNDPGLGIVLFPGRHEGGERAFLRLMAMGLDESEQHLLGSVDGLPAIDREVT